MSFGAPSAEAAKPSFLQKAGMKSLDTLDFITSNLGRLGYAGASMAKAATDKKSDSFVDILKAGGKGLALKEKIGYDEVLGNIGMKDSKTRKGLGFGLDILLDLTTYIGGVGAASKIAKAGGTGARLLTKAGNKAFAKTTERIAANMISDAGAKLTKAEAMNLARKSAEKVINRAIDTSPEYAKKYLEKGGLKFGRIEAFGKTISEGVSIPGTAKFYDIVGEAGNTLKKKYGGLIARDNKIIGDLNFERAQQRSRDLLHSDHNRFEDMIVNNPIMKLPKDAMQKVTTAIEDGTWRSLKGEEYDAALGWKKLQKNVITYLRESGVPIKVIDNYITHIYKNADIADTKLSRAKDGVTITDQFTKQRQYRTLKDAVANDLEPEYDLVKLAEARISSAVRAANRTKFLREVGRDFGIPETVLQQVEKDLPLNVDFNKKLSARMAKNKAEIAALESSRAGKTAKELVKIDSRIEKLSTKKFREAKNITKNIVKKIDNPELDNATVPLQRVDVKELEGKMVPKHFVEYIKEMDAKVFNDEKISKALQNYDAVQNFYKSQLTVMHFPFHVRNYLSNIMQNTLDIGLMQTLNPKINFWSNDILIGRNLDRTIKVGDSKYTLREIKEMANDLGVMGSPGYFDVQGKASKINVGRRVGSYIENEARITSFIANIVRSGDPVTAAERTKKFLFDYNNISNFEKSVVKRFIPFWTWPSKNFALMASQIVTNPGKINAFGKIYSGSKTGTEGEWLKNQFTVNIGGDKYLYGFGVPLESFAKQLNNPIRETVLMLNPIAKGLIEFGSGTDTFTGKKLEDMGEKGTDILRIIPESIREKFGIFTVTRKDKDGTEYTKVRVHPYMAHFLRSLPTSRYSTNVGKIADERQSVFEKSLALTTGMNVATYSPTDVYLELEKKYKEDAAKPMISKGYIKKSEYGTYYRDKKVSMTDDELKAVAEVLKILNTSYVKDQGISQESRETKPLQKSPYSRSSKLEEMKKSIYKKKI
jgi:hypothetical protein